MKSPSGVTPEVLEACLQALERGQAIEEVLARYPEQAANLAPLLQAAQSSRALASTLRMPLGARARSRARFLAHAKTLPSAAASAGARLPRLGLAWGSVAVVLVLILSLVVTTLASAQALPGQPLYPIKRAVEAVQYNLTADPSARLAFAETLDEKRAAEVQALIQQGQQQRVAFAGFLIRNPMASWEVHRIPLLLSPDQEALARSLEGAYVNIEGESEPMLGVRVERLELQLLAVRGTLREVTADYLRIDGLTLWLSPATQRRGGLQVGQSVSATVVRLAQDQYLALVVQGQGGDGAIALPDVSATPWQELRRNAPHILPSPLSREATPEPRLTLPPGLLRQTERSLPTVHLEVTVEREDKDANKTPEPTRTLRPSKTPRPTEFEIRTPAATKSNTPEEHKDNDDDD
ncbi:DUF5667 domain-containing protein [uncultured Thermanaerothrix sp.]|uniref:DUF5667 domain-containing protein n=1 Tax=uncultured Thermanaerothrix sp. TaxID=1195149 RepID=UPI002616A668|nr:DUF5667 domain-containing protein [uncultured Thermanaerothrix sp.]